MNERIQELKNQTLDRHFARTWTTMDYGDINRFAEGFARLIVQECVRYLNEDYQRDFDTLWREDLTKNIKQHFGIEE